MCTVYSTKVCVGQCVSGSVPCSRHIERRYLKLQEWVAEGNIAVKYVNTNENRADMFTKPLDRETFEKHASGIMGW